MPFPEIVDKGFARLQRDHLSLFLFHIGPVDDVLGDGGIGGRPADAEPLQLLDQGAEGKPSGRLGLFLLQGFLHLRNQLAGLHRGEQLQPLLVPLLLLLLVGLGIDLEKAVEFQHPPGGLELLSGHLEDHGGGVVAGRGHLACHGPPEYQLVEPGMIGGKPFLPDDGGDVRGRMHVRGADPFMGIGLGVFRCVPDWFCREILRTERLSEELAYLGDECLVHAHRVGAVIGRQAVVEQPLRQLHGLLRGELQAHGGGRLQVHRGERRFRRLAGFLPVHLDGQGVGFLLNGFDDRLGIDQFPEFSFHMAGEEERPLLVQLDVEHPVRGGDKVPDFPLPVHHQAHGGGLDPADAVLPPEAPARQGREDIAHQPVADPPAEECVVQARVGLLEGDRPGQGLLQPFLGDLEHLHAQAFPGDRLHLLVDVAADGVPFPVRVAGEHDGFAPGRGPELVGQVLFLSVVDEGRFIALQVHAHVGIGKVLEVSDRGHGFHFEDGLYLLRLGRRFDDDEHGAGYLVGLRCRVILSGRRQHTRKSPPGAMINLDSSVEVILRSLRMPPSAIPYREWPPVRFFF